MTVTVLPYQETTTGSLHVVSAMCTDAISSFLTSESHHTFVGPANQLSASMTTLANLLAPMSLA